MEPLHATSDGWRAIAHEVSVGLNPGPVPTDGALYMLPAGERGGYAIVQWLSGEPVAVDTPDAASEALDARLREVVGRSLPGIHGD